MLEFGRRTGLLGQVRYRGALSLALALMVLVVGTGSGYAQREPGGPLSVSLSIGDPMATVVSANQRLRSQLIGAMFKAAESLGIRISKDHLVFASREDVILSVAAVENLERIGPEELASGAVIGLMLLARPNGGALVRGIPGGFTLSR